MKESADPRLAVNWLWVGRVLGKTLLLFLAINLLFAWVEPMPVLGRITLYNHLLPGRERLPFGDDPTRSYNVSVTQLEAMFSSHIIAGGDMTEETFRILLYGDSSVWGFLLEPGQTLAAEINRRELSLPDGRRVRAYNLGYPTFSLTKDWLIQEQAFRYRYDAVLWFVTLESLPRESQLDSPLLRFNPGPLEELSDAYGIQFFNGTQLHSRESLYQRSILGRRRELADMIRLQLYGFMWASTGIDHHIPEQAPRRIEDLEADNTYQSFQQGELQREDLGWEVLRAAIGSQNPIPVLVVNEPIFRSTGSNSDIRYNHFYPIWAYDRYRLWMLDYVEEQGWLYLDLWDLLEGERFTDSAVHYNYQGVQEVVDALEPALRDLDR